MPPRIPGKEIKIGKVQLIHEVRIPSRMLMPPMKHHHRTTPCLRCRPITIEERNPVVSLETPLFCDTRNLRHQTSFQRIASRICCMYHSGPPTKQTVRRHFNGAFLYPPAPAHGRVGRKANDRQKDRRRVLTRNTTGRDAGDGRLGGARTNWPPVRMKAQETR